MSVFKPSSQVIAEVEDALQGLEESLQSIEELLGPARHSQQNILPNDSDGLVRLLFGTPEAVLPLTPLLRSVDVTEYQDVYLGIGHALSSLYLCHQYLQGITVDESHPLFKEKKRVETALEMSKKLREYAPAGNDIADGVIGVPNTSVNIAAAENIVKHYCTPTLKVRPTEKKSHKEASNDKKQGQDALVIDLD